MLIGLWSPKGGSGVSTTSAMCALAASRQAPTVLVDPFGDVTALLGVAPPKMGWGELVDAAELPVDGVDRVAVHCGEFLRLVGPGRQAARGPIGRELVRALRASAPTVVLDLGRGDEEAIDGLVEQVDEIVLVLRPCYLAVRRAINHPLVARSIGCFFVNEPGRSLSDRDVATATGCRVLASVPLRPTIARAIDAGTVVYRSPEPYVRAVRALFEEIERREGTRAA